MYGLLIEGVQKFVENTYGEDMWQAVLETSQVNQLTFQTRTVYHENVLRRILSTLSDLLGISLDDIMFANGQYFVGFLSRYGYDKILRVLGRDFHDFIKGLDNLHEYLRFSYPKLKPPSFVLGEETKNGIVLHYRTRRPGFHHYVRGQLVKIAGSFYEIELNIQLIQEKTLGVITHYTFLLLFDKTHSINGVNKGPVYEATLFKQVKTIHSESFFSIFPFHMVISSNLKILKTGIGFQHLQSNIVGLEFEEIFIICRPLIDISWEMFTMHTHNVFEFVMLRKKNDGKPEGKILSKRQRKIAKRTSSMLTGMLKFKGEMMMVKAWDALLFIGTPIIRDVAHLEEVGLCVNDLNMHDTSRDVIFAGSQQSDELMELFEKQMENSKHLEESMKRVAAERERTSQLLYQCIPKRVAKRLKRGESSESTIRAYDCVSICFSKVVNFTEICGQTEVLQIVNLLNSMYTLFDNLTEAHKVYKVETIGDSYMLVSGVPNQTDLHAAHIVEMALDMITSSEKLINPAEPSTPIQLMMGCHSGPVVTGVVGIKMPRYCLFGDSVNTASRMMSHGEPNKVHISSTLYEQIRGFPYVLAQRGTMEVKGKGKMMTYFVNSRSKGSAYSIFIDKLEVDRLDDADSGDESENNSRLTTPMLENVAASESEAEFDFKSNGNGNDIDSSQVFKVDIDHLRLLDERHSKKEKENKINVTQTTMNSKRNYLKPKREIKFLVSDENSNSDNLMQKRHSILSIRPYTPPPKPKSEESNSDSFNDQLVNKLTTILVDDHDDASNITQNDTECPNQSSFKPLINGFYKAPRRKSGVCNIPPGGRTPKSSIDELPGGSQSSESESNSSETAERISRQLLSISDNTSHLSKGSYSFQLSHLGNVLSLALTDLVMKKPADPIYYLAIWLRNYDSNDK